MKRNIAILASGSGTNAENIIRYFSKSTSVCIKLVLSNKEDAYVLRRAESLGVPFKVFLKDQWAGGCAILLKKFHPV